MIINLYKTKIEEQPDIKYKPLIEYLSKATGIGRDTICNTIRHYKKNNQLKSPNKQKIRARINEKIDDFHKNAIRQKIHGFWLRNEIPTLKKIVQVLSDDPYLPTIPRTSLQRILTRRWSRGERFSHYDIILVTTVCYIGLLPISCAIPYQIQII